MPDTSASPPERPRDARYTIYRVRQQTLCSSCGAVQSPPILILWVTAAQAQAHALTHCTRCSRYLLNRIVELLIADAQDHDVRLRRFLRYVTARRYDCRRALAVQPDNLDS